jgi:hypothetical protein
MAGRESLFQSLSHEIRQSIMVMLSGEPRTYTYLLDELGVESGHLAYHLRQMGGVVEKDGEGVYHLTALGVEAYLFLKDETPEPQRERTSTQNTFTNVIYLLLILATVSSVIVLNRTDITELYNGFYLGEAVVQVDRSLTTVYDVFDQQGVSRATWTDMVFTLTRLKDSLERLDGSVINCTHEVTLMRFYVDEFTEVMLSGDDEYPGLAIELRPLIREYHSLLVELEPRLRDAL